MQEANKRKIDNIIYELGVNAEDCRSITDKILKIIENNTEQKRCPVCECWIPLSSMRCHFCESDICEYYE